MGSSSGPCSDGHMTQAKRKEGSGPLSRWFNPHYMTDNPAVQAFLDALSDELTMSEQRKKKRKASADLNFRRCVAAIVLDLFRARLARPEYLVGIGKGRTQISDDRKVGYEPAFKTPDAFLDAMNDLEVVGYIETDKRFTSPIYGGKGETRRYRLSDSCLARLQAVGATVLDLIKSQSAPGLILKGRKDPKTGSAKRIKFSSVPFTDEAARRLSIINECLSAHWYDLELSDTELADYGRRIVRGGLEAREGDDEDYRAIDLSARTLHRVFNNESWDEGGRFYGGWWQNLPKELRPYITIDFKRTIEIDYSGIHPAILLARAGYAVPDDPYGRCLEGSTDPALRECVKRTFNALLNAPSVIGLKPIEEFSEELTGKSWNDFKGFIVNKYPEFKGEFGTGEGLRLQRVDSDLAEEIMLACVSRGYACLPVHDSFIVHRGYEPEVKDLMKTVFERRFGVGANLKFRTEQPSYPNFDASPESFLEHGYEEEGYLAREYQWYEKQGKNLGASIGNSREVAP